jgi:hypothetical protein
MAVRAINALILLLKNTKGWPGDDAVAAAKLPAAADFAEAFTRR